ncbi:MAG: ABC transporter permease [Coriobacteriales bacterium]|jgi:ABC-2 type transport system permease protein|nr:ABC transporter permease [Coriobacteriales bacterium]
MIKDDGFAYVVAAAIKHPVCYNSSMDFSQITPADLFAVLSAAVILGCVIAFLFVLPKVRRMLPGLLQYRHLLSTMVVRDIKVKYRRSVLGILWSILNPLMMMIILTIVFSTIFRFNIENFPVYYIVGSTMYSFVTGSTTSGMNSVLNNAELIKKVYIPKYIFPLQKVLFSLVNLAFSLIAVAIVYAILQMPLHPTIPLLVIPVFYATVFSFGLSLVLSAAVVYFRDIAHLYGVLTMAWMYLTPIFYPFVLLPEIAQTVLQFNPLLHFVNYAREVMMYGSVPGLYENLYCMAFAIVTLVIGLLFFRRAQDNFILNI